MTRSLNPLLIEAHRVNYRLRSTFFYHKIKEYNVLTFPSIIANLLPVEKLYNWDERVGWGISERAFRYVSDHKQLKLIQVFCHPKLLREYPSLLAYYRNIAALSQKSVNYLTGITIARHEVNPDNLQSLSDTQVLSLARLFNEHITLIIDSSLQSFTEQELYGLLLTSTGAQIDGAWRNAIGEEAEKVVQVFLIKEAIKRQLLQALIPRNGTTIEPYTPEKLEGSSVNVKLYRGIMLGNQTSILFSSEPDITLVGKQGATAGIIEVKGGTDPAGALERYGAAKKSFENTLRHSPDTKTVLIASCITDEVRERIDQDPTISHYFNLTEIISDPDIHDQLMEVIYSLLSGI